MITYNGVTGGSNADGSQVSSLVSLSGGSSSSSSSGNRTVDTIFNNSGQTLGGIADIISAIKGYNVPSASQYYGPGAPGMPAGRNSMLWIIVAVVAALILVFLLMRGAKK